MKKKENSIILSQIIVFMNINKIKRTLGRNIHVKRRRINKNKNIEWIFREWYNDMKKMII